MINKRRNNVEPQIRSIRLQTLKNYTFYQSIPAVFFLTRLFAGTEIIAHLLYFGCFILHFTLYFTIISKVVYENFRQYKLEVNNLRIEINKFNSPLSCSQLSNCNILTNHLPMYKLVCRLDRIL